MYYGLQVLQNVVDVIVSTLNDYEFRFGHIFWQLLAHCGTGQLPHCGASNWDNCSVLDILDKGKS